MVRTRIFFCGRKRFVNCQTQLVREEVTFFFVAHRSPLSSGIPGREPRLLASRRQCQLWAAIAGSDDNWKRPALPAAKKEKKRGKTMLFFSAKPHRELISFRAFSTGCSGPPTIRYTTDPFTRWDLASAHCPK